MGAGPAEERRATRDGNCTYRHGAICRLRCEARMDRNWRRARSNGATSVGAHRRSLDASRSDATTVPRYHSLLGLAKKKTTKQKPEVSLAALGRLRATRLNENDP